MQRERRLKLEIELVRRTFREGFRHQPADEGVVGRVTTNGKHSYLLWLDLRAFPDDYPRVYVVTPRLLDSDGKPLQSMRHDMHTSEADAHGNVQICHSSSQRWSPQSSLLSVLLKCRIWLEAYESHLRTGRTISALLPTQS